MLTPVNFERLKKVEELAKKKSATVAQIALAWLLAQKIKVYPIVSSSNINRFKENIGCLKLTLNDDERII